MKFLAHLVNSVFNILRILFSIVAVPVYIPKSSTQVFYCLTYFSTLLVLALWIIAIQMGVKWICYCNFHLSFPDNG